MRKSNLIYQVFVRQTPPNGDFKSVAEKLPKLRRLGVDILYLMPINEITTEKRKGSLGSPYASKDYYSIDKSYGTIADLKYLIDVAHKLNMKVICDFAFNHMGVNNDLVKTNPEFFYKNEKGEFGNRFGDWWDVIDLNYENKKLWNYLVKVIKYWNRFFDGYRFDVASVVPLEFWKYLRKKTDPKKTKIWFAESIDPFFLKSDRKKGFDISSDAELYSVFDMLYTYDNYYLLKHYYETKDKKDLLKYVYSAVMQQTLYPKDYIKVNYLDNHDNARFASFIKDEVTFKNMLSLMFYLKGMSFIYQGTETNTDHLPTLFEKDFQKEGKNDYSELIENLRIIKDMHLLKHGFLDVYKEEPLVLYYISDKEFSFAIFPFGKPGKVKLPVEDKVYNNLYNKDHFTVKNGFITYGEEPLIFKGDIKYLNESIR